MATRPPPLPRSSLGLACAWAWALAAAAALGAARGRTEEGLSWALLLAVGLLPLAWAQATAREDHHPWRELSLLGAVATPALVVLAGFSASATRGAACVYAALVLVAGALLLARAPRRLAVACCGALGLALPLTLKAWADLSGEPPAWLAAAVPPLAVEGILAGAPLTPPLLWLAGALTLGALAAWAWRRRARAARARGGRSLAPAASSGLALSGLALSGLALSGLALSGLALESALASPQAEPVLGAHVRPGEPYPLSVRGVGEPLAGRSFSHRTAGRRVGAEQVLAPVPLGGGQHLGVEVLRAGRWERLAVELPTPRPLGSHELLVGWLGEDAGPLAASLVADRRARLVQLRAASLPLVAAEGSALDAILVAPGSARLAARAAALRAWTAAGGVLVCADPADLAAVCGSGSASASGAEAPGGASEPQTRDGLQARALGAGRALAPEPGASLGSARSRPALRRALGRRLEARARRTELAEVAQLEEDPRPSPAQAWRAAWALLAAALAWTLLAGLRARLGATTLAIGAWPCALLLALLLRALAAPSGAVYAKSLRVLEAPSGGSLAQRSEVLTLAALRPSAPALTFEGFASPRPLFSASLDAVRSAGSLAPATGEAPPRLRLPLQPGELRTFSRLDACELGGSVRVGPDAITNTSALPLRELLLFDEEGVRELPDLAPGASLRWDEVEARALGQWRYDDVDLREARRRRLLATLVSSRRGRTLLARLSPRPAIREGAAGEQATRLLVVSALE